MAEQNKLLDSLRRQCSRREYCTVDILRKIRNAKARAGDASFEGAELDEAEIVGTLRKEGFLSDGRYASAFARDKASLEGWGPLKIRYALRSKGLDDNLIDSALCEVDSASADRRMEKLLIAKYRSLKEDPACRLKLLKYALGRGYSYDDAAAAVARLTCGGEGI